MPMWLYFFIIYFCSIWAFSSTPKHLLITLLSLDLVVLVIYFSVYFYLCSFNHSLFFGFFCMRGLIGPIYFGFYNS